MVQAMEGHLLPRPGSSSSCSSSHYLQENDTDKIYKFAINTYILRGSAKLKKFQKSKTNLDRAHPAHPHHPNFFFGNPSLTWTEHTNPNNQQLLAMHVQTEYTSGLHNKHWPAGPPAICSRRASDMQLLLARRATKFFFFFFLPNHVLYVVPYVGF